MNVSVEESHAWEFIVGYKLQYIIRWHNIDGDYNDIKKWVDESGMDVPVQFIDCPCVIVDESDYSFVIETILRFGLRA